MIGLLLFCECFVEKAFLESSSFYKKVSKILNSSSKGNVFNLSLSVYLVL